MKHKAFQSLIIILIPDQKLFNECRLVIENIQFIYNTCKRQELFAFKSIKTLFHKSLSSGVDSLFLFLTSKIN